MIHTGLTETAESEMPLHDAVAIADTMHENATVERFPIDRMPIAI